MKNRTATWVPQSHPENINCLCILKVIVSPVLKSSPSQLVESDSHSSIWGLNLERRDFILSFHVNHVLVKNPWIRHQNKTGRAVIMAPAFCDTFKDARFQYKWSTHHKNYSCWQLLINLAHIGNTMMYIDVVEHACHSGWIQESNTRAQAHCYSLKT